MMPTRLLAAALFLLAGWAMAPAAHAQGKDVFALRAAFGGAVPFAQKDSYVVANLAGEGKQGQVALASSLPLSRSVLPIFDARPQVILNGRLDLGPVGLGDLSLIAYVSAGVVPVTEDAARPLLGLATLRLVF